MRYILVAPIWVLMVTVSSTLLQPCGAKQREQNSSIYELLTSEQAVATLSTVVGSDKQKLSASPKSGTSLASSMLRAYIRTNNMRAYHLDLHSYRAEKMFAGDAAHVDSRSASHQARCARHLAQYHALLRAAHQTDPMDENASLEALQLADMFGRPPAGLLEGNQFWLGSHDNCVEHELELANESASEQPERVKSQYCLGLAQFASWNARDTKTSIKIGLCLPETCSNSMLNDQIDQASHLLQEVEQMMLSQLGNDSPFHKLKLRSVYCLPHESSELRRYSLSAKLFVALICALVFVACYATVYDYLNNKLEREKNELVARRQILGAQQIGARSVRTVLVEAFSLTRNIEKLMKTDSGQQRGTNSQPGEFKFDRETFSNSITAIKCLGLFWIIAAHTFLVSPIPSSNLASFDKLTSTWVANIYLSAHLMVDTFFALSGVLAAYLLFKSDLGHLKRSQWFVLTVHRYWRLTPVYLLCYWFTKSLGHLVNSGPLWDYASAEQSPRFRCEQESWAEALLHMSDFKSPKEHCVPFAWFIANGIKFWLVTPFLLTAIHKSMKRGYLITCALILANMLLVAKLAFSSNVDMKSVIEFKPESAENMLNNMDQVYTRPYSRIGAYLIGLLAGHYFYLIDTKQVQVNLSKNSKIILWTLFAVTTIVMTFVVKLANGLPLDDSAIPYVFSVCCALIRPLWALCSCWLVFALAHGQARWLANIFSANIWKILVKLSFCAYLAQGEVIAHLYLAQTHSNAFTYVDLVTRPIVANVLTMFASVFILLLVEYPLIGIEELLLPPKRPKTSEKKSAADEQQLLHDTQNQHRPTKSADAPSNELTTKFKEA